MNKEIKNPKNAVKSTTYKQWKCIMSVVRKIPRTNILVLQKLSKIDQCFYQIALFLAKKIEVH